MNAEYSRYRSLRTTPKLLAVALMMTCSHLGSLLGTETSQREFVFELINQMGSGVFSQREAAMRELSQMGTEIIPIVEQALDDPDREVRLRVKVVLERLNAIDRRDRLNAFSEGRPDPRQRTLPGWRKLQALVGKTAGSRRLLIAMLQQEWDLLAKSEDGAESAEATLTNRVEELQYRRAVDRSKIELGTVAALLLVASDPDLAIYPQVQRQIASFCYSVRIPPTAPELQDVTYQAIKQLIAAWIRRPNDPIVAYQCLSLAQRHGLRDGLIPARRLLQDGTGTANIRQFAVLTLIRFGDEGEIEFLEGLLEDESVCHEEKDPKTREPRFQCQLRDAALAGLFQISGQDPRQHGFSRLRTSPQSVFVTNTLGFTDEEARQESLRQWKLLRAKAAGESK